MNRIRVGFIVVFIITLFHSVSAFSKQYPYVNGYDIWISEHYRITDYYKFASDKPSDRSAIILCTNGFSRGVGKLFLGKNRDIECAGKYKGKFYFNVLSMTESYALYTIRPGDKAFKKVSSGINIEYINKKNLLPGGYIIGRKNYPTDSADGYGSTFLYNLKNDKKVSLGHVLDIRKSGNRLIYLKREDKNGDVILKVYQYAFNGMKKKLIKTVNTKVSAADSYGSGKLTQNNVVYTYMDSTGASHVYSEKY